MECYKVLDVDENATMEEIKEAYENKVKQFREEIKDERRAKKFIEVFDKAYEEIKLERENTQNQQTMIMNINDTALKNYQKNDFDKVEECNYVFRRDEIDEEEGNFIITKEKRKSYSKKSSSKNKKSNKKASENKDKDRSKEKSKNESNKKVVIKKKKESYSIGTIIKLPFKIVAFPVIIVLSIILFLCKILSLMSWIASKVIMIASIAGASIHGYQVYIGHAIQYKIFILCAIGFIVALFLPSILNILPNILEGINNRLKRFVF